VARARGGARGAPAPARRSTARQARRRRLLSTCPARSSSIHTLAARYGPKPRTEQPAGQPTSIEPSLLHALNQCNVQNGLLLF
jgi:hypothetical protein